jgi:3'-phosphoadenosine 5'-phosphosulfate sulfotransferase (PAPS reductase)/FAD synthetase
MKKLPNEVQEAEVIFVNHSGGKDSQAMLAHLVKIGLKDKLVIVHADLGEMEWEPMHNWIESTSFGLSVNVVKGDIGFFELCRKYNKIPGGTLRFCTNELKTKPCESFMKAYCAERGITKAISALGIRAEESPSRASKGEIIPKLKGTTKKHPLKLTVWNPILGHTLEDVNSEIEKAGQEKHWVYSKGYTRLSCVMCPFGKINEHKMMAKDRNRENHQNETKERC